MAYTVADILVEMNSHGFEDIAPAQLLYFINDAYYELCSQPYPFLERSASVTMVSGSATIPIVDADSHTVNKIISITNDTQGFALRPIRLDTLNKQFTGALTQAGAPAYYYRLNGAILGYPVNNTADTLTCQYTITPKELGIADTPVVPIQFRRIITNGALYRAYMMNDDVDIAQYFKKEVQEHTIKAQEDFYRIQTDQPDYMTDTDDDTQFWGLNY